MTLFVHSTDEQQRNLITYASKYKYYNKIKHSPRFSTGTGSYLLFLASWQASDGGAEGTSGGPARRQRSMAESGAELASGAQLAAHSQGIPEVRWASGSASMQSIAIAKSGIIKVCSKWSYLYVELIANLDARVPGRPAPTVRTTCWPLPPAAEGRR